MSINKGEQQMNEVKYTVKVEDCIGWDSRRPMLEDQTA